MSRFVVEKTPLEGLKVLRRQPIGDERGFLERMFCSDELKPIIGQRSVAQINHTLTASVGTVRGLHLQHPPHGEMKLVTCLRGEVFDVAVDLREGSPTFLQWRGVILNENNHCTLCIPEGFAHGFQTMTDDCEMIYLHTAAYVPEAEVGLNALDPRLGIAWPMPIAERSARDQQHAMLTSDFSELSI